jgi:hypothetical protein
MQLMLFHQDLPFASEMLGEDTRDALVLGLNHAERESVIHLAKCPRPLSRMASR